MKNIIFDIGCVLVIWDPDRVYKSYFKGDVKLMKQFYTETGIFNKNKEIDRGRPYHEVLAELIVSYPQYQEPILYWREKWLDMIGGAIEGSVEILKSLSNQGYPLFGLSNWPTETFSIIAARYDFWEYFNDIIISGEVKEIKPETKIYQILLEKHRLDPKECIFIDDNKDNIKTAQKLNINTILFQDPIQLERDLNKFKIYKNINNKLGGKHDV